MSFFNAALAHFQRGELAAAETALVAALKQDPTNADAVHLMAGIRHALGDLTGAAPLFERAHQLAPQDASIAFNRAAVLSALARHAECVEACAVALRLRAGDPEALFLQGVALAALGRHDEAIKNYEAAHLDRADFHAHRAASLMQLERPEEALAAAARATELSPRNADGHYHRGVAHGALGQWAESLASLDAALALSPENVAIRAARAPALANHGRFDEALSEIDVALARHPRNVEYLMRRAYVLSAARRDAEALTAYDAVLALCPGDAEAQYAKADLLLARGDFEHGLPLYEARWRLSGARFSPTSISPLWTGEEPIQGKTVLVQGEQGFGDLFQFGRLVPMLAARGAKVILQERPQTLSLMQSLAGVDRLAPVNEPAPAADFHIPLASLLRVLNIRLDTIPTAIPYLYAEPSRVARWRETLGPARRRRIGVVWSGVNKHAMQRWRSLNDASLGELLKANGDFISLQMEPSPVAAACGVRQFGRDIAEFAELAALIETLDFVVSIDTGVAHLAGALGKPVWTLLPFRPDWRWLRDRSDTPWYPNMRLFRQPGFDDWRSVIADVHAALQE